MGGWQFISDWGSTVKTIARQAWYLANPLNWPEVYQHSQQRVGTLVGRAKHHARQAQHVLQERVHWQAPATSLKWLFSTVFPFSLRTAGYWFMQLATLPRLAHRLSRHAPSQQLAGDVARMAAYDVLPLVLLHAAADHLYRGAQSYLMAADDDEESRHWYLYSAQLTLSLLQLAVKVYAWRRQTRLIARNAVLVLEAAGALNESKERHLSLCRDEKCTGQRFAQGVVRDTLAFALTELAIKAVETLPYLGSSLPQLLRVSLYGRYILGASMPELCARHQWLYFRQQPELVLSLGLAYVGYGATLPALIERYTGFRSPYLDAALQQQLLFLLMATAIDMPIPAPTGNKARWTFDPVDPFQRVVGAGVDISLLGLKKYVPRLLKEADAGIDWFALGRSVDAQWQARPGQLLRRFLLDDALHSLRAFRQDPLVSRHWPALRDTGRTISRGILAYQTSIALRIAAVDPRLAGQIADFFFAYPKSVVTLAIKLMSSKEFMRLLEKLQTHLAHESDLPKVQARASLLLTAQEPHSPKKHYSEAPREDLPTLGQPPSQPPLQPKEQEKLAVRELLHAHGMFSPLVSESQEAERARLNVLTRRETNQETDESGDLATLRIARDRQ
ncbi:MAG: hypothetical protein JJT82_02210 [Legionellaceae bacterium]|nr:hypothetical protein [Legionellaceae bacterium]